MCMKTRDTICPKCRSKNAVTEEDLKKGTKDTYCVDCKYKDEKVSWVGYLRLVLNENFYPKKILDEKLSIEEGNQVAYYNDYHVCKYTREFKDFLKLSSDYNHRYLVIEIKNNGKLLLRPFINGEDIEVDEKFCLKLGQWKIDF